jgi:hypothetical protein
MRRKRKETFKSAPISEENRQHILAILREDGFTEKQLNKMPWERVWKLYLDSIGELVSRELSPIYYALEKNPRLAIELSPFIKELHKIAEDLEKSVKESDEGRDPK